MLFALERKRRFYLLNEYHTVGTRPESQKEAKINTPNTHT